MSDASSLERLNYLLKQARQLEPGTGPWKVCAPGEDPCDNWPIASFGASTIDARYKSVEVATDRIHASDMEGDALTDAQWMVWCRNELPGLLELATWAALQLEAKWFKYVWDDGPISLTVSEALQERSALMERARRLESFIDRGGAPEAVGSLPAVSSDEALLPASIESAVERIRERRDSKIMEAVDRELGLRPDEAE